MNLHYHDREPLSEKMQDMINDHAATKMLLKENGSREKELNEAKPKKTMICILLCFILLYIVCTLLATRSIWQDYEARYKENTAIEFYDSYGFGVPITKPHLKMEIEKGTEYYFPVGEYFQKAEIESLFQFLDGNSDKYTIEAQIDEASHTLVSMKISDSVPVWWWENQDAASYDEGKLVSFYKRAKVGDVVFEGWQENGLQVAVEVMMPIYIIGFVIMAIGIVVAVSGYNKMKRKNVGE